MTLSNEAASQLIRDLVQQIEAKHVATNQAIVLLAQGIEQLGVSNFRVEMADKLDELRLGTLLMADDGDSFRQDVTEAFDALICDLRDE